MSVFKHKRKSDNRERFFDSACICQKRLGECSNEELKDSINEQRK